MADDTAVIYTSDHGDNTGARGLWGKSTFYEESAGVPMIVAGPGLPSGDVVDVPVSHVDCAPAILDAAGATPLGPLYGHSLFDIANGAMPARPILCEYHAIGSSSGAFMLRHGRYKYCHYPWGGRRSCSISRAIPRNSSTLRATPATRRSCGSARRGCAMSWTPEAVDARAKSRQASLLEAFGGREKALARGDLGFTPAPGTRAELD